MLPLKIDLNAIEQLAEKHRQLVKQVSQINSAVNSMTYRMDNRILARRNIRSRMRSAEIKFESTRAANGETT